MRVCIDHETCWGRLGWFWWRLGAIRRSLGDVLGALGVGVLLDILEVSLRARWATICQDLDRNPRNKIEKKLRKTTVFLPEWARAQGSLLVGGPLGLRPTQGQTQRGRLNLSRKIVFLALEVPKKSRILVKI